MGSINIKAKNLYKIVEENYITQVGGTLTKIAEEINIYTTEEGINMYSNTSIDMKAKNETVLGTYKEPPEREPEENVVNIESELYMHNNQELKIPYLDSLKSINFKSSKLFIAGLKSIFGDDIGHEVAKKLMQDLEKGNVPYPKWGVVNLPLYSNVGGYFLKGKIYLNQNLILEAEKDPEKSWLLFRVMIEETGHYIEYLLRNKYDDIGGDAKGDEGTLFAADFIKYNGLLFKDFEFAKFKIESSNGEVREFNAKVLMGSPDREQKARELLFVEDDSDDQGIVTLKNGKNITVEFFKIRGQGAVHENITKQAAKIAGVKYDYRLDEGCAWPDVPCGNENSVETCYYKTWKEEHTEGTMAYRTHHGDLQFWHSMSPSNELTNQEVVDKIVNQAKKWYMKAKEVEKEHVKLSKVYPNYSYLKKENYFGLFHIGKILHMVQDGYSESHIVRDKKGFITNIQSYNNQDTHKHGKSDAVDQNNLTWAQRNGPKKDGVSILNVTNEQVNALEGTKEAKEASVYILKMFKEQKPTDDLEKYLRNTVYPFANDKLGKSYGTHKSGEAVEKYNK
ncbi:hypothetical protein [Tenacibaculum sp. SDUM215027]|uniref:hypothetical protein n=1 Tax=Tenacibaculum sp. SDUM215027 TaxID=3422596 RepID=UPI003D3175C7